MKNFIKIATITFGTLVVFSLANAQSSSNARSVGMSDAYMCLAVGSEAVSFNPANLSFPMQYSTTVNLFGIGGQIANNSISNSEYNYFNGRTLTENDKSSLLATIPADGLLLNGNASAHAMGFSYKSFALNAQLSTSLNGSVSKDLLDLALNGNKFNKTYAFQPGEAEGIAFGQIAVGYGMALPVKNQIIQHAGLGVTLKYLKGYSYFDLDESDINTITQITSAEASGNISIREAKGGHGYAVDIGTILTLNRSRFAIVVKNMSSIVQWNNNTQTTKYSFLLEEENAEKLFTGELSAGSLFSTTDTTFVINSFSTKLPMALHVGYLYPFRTILLAAELAHEFKHSLPTQTPRFSLGLEYRPNPHFHVRAGSRLSKNYGFSTSLGIGVLSGIVRWDIAVRLYNAIVPQSSKGFSFATSLVLRI